MTTRKDFALTAADRIDARTALALLDGTGLTLTDAARMACTGRKALDRVTVEVAAERYLLAKSRADIRERSREWYVDKIRLITAKFGLRLIDDITRAEIIAWIPTVSKARGSQAAAARAAVGLWRWAASQEPALVATNVCTDLPTTGPTNQGDADFLTAAEVAAVMAVAGPYRSALALMFFGGIRPDEMAGRGKPRLLWKHVNVAEKLIRIPSDIAKTGKPRIVEGLPDAVWAWLQPGEPDTPISIGRTREAARRAKTVLARKWPHDAPRHSFATHALAQTAQPGQVATWLGHEGNPSLLHRTYRGLASKADAEAYFGIRPKG